MPTILDKRLWAETMLKQGLGNSHPSANTIKFVLAWQIHESGAGAVIGCDHNPLNVAGHNSDEPIACGSCNAVGVNNYCSYQDGIRATAARLKHGLYPSLEHALATNDENNLGFNGHRMAANVAGDLEVWVSGQRTGHLSYVNAILQLAGQKTLPSGGDAGQVTPVGGTTPSPNDVLSGLTDWLNTTFGPEIPFLQDPSRIIKIGVGILLIGLAVLLLLTPEAYPVANQISRTAGNTVKGAKSLFS